MDSTRPRPPCALFASLAMLVLAAGCGLTKSPKGAADEPAAGAGGSRTMQSSVSFEIEVPAPPAGTGAVKLWLPLPKSSPSQKVTNIQIEPAGSVVSEDRMFGNRTAFFEWDDPAAEPIAVKLSYDLARHEETLVALELSAVPTAGYLLPSSLGIVDKRVRDMAEEATAGKEGVRANARGIYDYVRAHMEYDKQTDGWGRGDTARACAVGKGNCSDYHSLFISIAQAKRIPARFHYGYSLKPGGEVGAHCWASFHTDEGWVPVDISEADKDPSRSDYFFGTLSENRVLVSTGRDLTLAPPQHAAPLNFLIDAYVEVDGQPLDPAAVAVTAKHTPAAAAP